MEAQTFKNLIKKLSEAKTTEEVLHVAFIADYSYQHGKIIYNDLDIINHLATHLIDGLSD